MAPPGQFMSGARQFSPVLRSARGLSGPIVFIVLAATVLLVAGCGGNSNKKSQTASDEAEEQDAPTQPAKPAPQPRKPAAPPAHPKDDTAGQQLSADVNQWKLSDLKLALVRKKFEFVPGVIDFALKAPGDNKRAADLDELLVSVGRMHDDALVTLPLPPGALGIPAASSGTPAGSGSPAMGVMRGGAGNRFSRGIMSNKKEQ